MRLPLVVLVILSVATLSAQQPAATKPKNTAAAAPKPKVLPSTPAPAPKRGVLSRIFGPKETPAPTPAPTTPKPVVKPTRPRPPKPPETQDPQTVSTKPAKPPKTTEPAVLDDATKYKNARKVALEDEQIQELKSKADSALDEDEAHRASIAYNRALFRKIRQVEPSIDGYVDQLESAMMKRLNSERPD